ncbi:hypothetical protein CVT26_003232 [Gymnopilus dilepis]|uniref:Uncharacterized protein n=1 Tax=Gymnopilus dilepis TaxID=231916 RepID=A0A409Y578_9AGAR|nr:hypothetical protein CVT26_003232 [Gymnopilus dilepis]
MPRAGLVFLLFCLASFIYVSVAAPIPESRPRLLERCEDDEQEYLARSLAILIEREFASTTDDLFRRDPYDFSILDDRDFDEIYDEYVKRGYDISIYDERALGLEERDDLEHDVVLLQKRNIFDKIREGFQRMGNAIKHGFQKFGSMVKSGFQKAGHAIKHAFQKAGSAIKHGFQKFGGMVKKGFQKAGSAIKHGFEKVKQGFQKAGSAIKHGFQKFGHMVKTGFQKAGHAIKKGFQKVGNWIKTTGAKVAKFGLKVYSAVASVASKVVKFIPIIGQPLSMAMKGASMGANIASNKIHADLGKLDKVAKGLDYVISPIGTFWFDLFLVISSQGVSIIGSAAKKMGGASIAANLLTREIELYYD